MNRIPLAMHPCEACQDSGIELTQGSEGLVFAVITRCDACERYPDDLRAAIAFLESNPGWEIDMITLKPTLE